MFRNDLFKIRKLFSVVLVIFNKFELLFSLSLKIISVNLQSMGIFSTDFPMLRRFTEIILRLKLNNNPNLLKITNTTLKNFLILNRSFLTKKAFSFVLVLI